MASQRTDEFGASDLVSEASCSTSFPETTPPGRLLVVSGPSGVGKTSVVAALLEMAPLHFSVSATTRAPRYGEVDGVDYQFVDEGTFRSMIEEGLLLEWAEYNGRLYGTVRASMLGQIDAGHDVVLDIENDGAHQIKESYPAAVLVFVAPPSFDVLEKRLRSRGDTTDAEINGRLAVARKQLEDAKQFYDHVVINDDLNEAVTQIAGILDLSGSARPLSHAPPNPGDTSPR